MKLNDIPAITVSLHHLTLEFLRERDEDSFGCSRGLVSNYIKDYQAATSNSRNYVSASETSLTGVVKK